VDALLKQFKVTADETPVVICADGRILRHPSNAELADCMDIRKPLEHTVYDLAVIGAGPAGLAAAVYGASEGLKSLVLDRMGPGGREAGHSATVECAAVFIFIGSTPHTNWLPQAIAVDGNGFVKTGMQLAESWRLRRPPFPLETSVPGVFAAGDVRCGSTKRVASAAGEGSMAVQFVHQYLASN